MAMLTAHARGVVCPLRASRVLAVRCLSSSSIQDGSSRKNRNHWAERGNRKQFLDELRQAHGIEDAQDWKKIGTKDVVEAGGGALLARFRGSVLALLQDTYPEEELTAETCRAAMPQGHWKDPENRRKFFDDLAAEHNVTKPEDWRRVTKRHMVAAGGRSLLAQFPSVFAALKDSYQEEFEGVAERTVRRKVSKGYWTDARARQLLLDIAADRGITSAEGWKQVTAQDVIAAGGGYVLEQYPSFFAMLAGLLPEYGFSEHDVREKLPQGFWAERENRRSFMLRLAAHLGINPESPNDWKKCTKRHATEFGGAGLMQRFNGSLLAVLQDTMPEVAGDMFECRATVTAGYWNDQTNRKLFLDGMEEEFAIVQPGDWQKVSIQDVKDRGGAGLLNKYPGGMLAMLRDVYPERNWDLLSCRNYVPEHYWTDPVFVKEFLDKAKVSLRIEDPSDWLRVSISQLRELNGGGLLKVTTLYDALVEAYPQEAWGQLETQARLLSSQGRRGKSAKVGKKSNQRNLLVQLHGIFPQVQQDAFA